MVLGSSLVAVTSTLDFAPASSKDFLDIQATRECGFTLKHVRDMTGTYSEMHRTDKYSEHRPIIWPVWPNGWVFVYELNGSGFESSYSHLDTLVFGLFICFFCFVRICHIIFFWIVTDIIKKTWKKKANSFETILKFSLTVLLSLCLIFCQCLAGVTWKECSFQEDGIW